MRLIAGTSSAVPITLNKVDPDGNSPITGDSGTPPGASSTPCDNTSVYHRGEACAGWCSWSAYAVPAIILLLLIMPSCNRRNPPELMLYDFNRQAELDNLSWSCRTVYSLDRQHAVSGYSLRLEMYPDLYPGLKNGRMENDWSGYDFLCLEIFNPGPQPLRLACRLDDRQDNPPYDDRVNCPVNLVPGANSVRLDLRALRTSGSGRPLNLSHIYRMCFFLCSPDKKVTLFVDDIRLSKT